MRLEYAIIKHQETTTLFCLSAVSIPLNGWRRARLREGGLAGLRGDHSSGAHRLFVHPHAGCEPRVFRDLLHGGDVWRRAPFAGLPAGRLVARPLRPPASALQHRLARGCVLSRRWSFGLRFDWAARIAVWQGFDWRRRFQSCQDRVWRRGRECFWLQRRVLGQRSHCGRVDP